MAKGGETISGLYLRIGLNYDELNQDFINVEESLSANIQRLNRQKTLIDIKAKVDLTGVEDAEQRLKVQQEALTKQVELQTQKVRLYETAWIAAVKANGAASQQAEKSAISLKNQELALAQLSQRLKEVTEQQKQLSQTKTDKANFDNSLLGKYTNIKGDVAGKISNLTNAFTGLKDASASADSAITKTLEIIGAIPSPVGKAVAALASIPLVARGIENSLLALAEPAIAAGDAVYVMSRGMQLSIADTAKLATVCKVTGIEINEVNSAMRRLSANLNKAGDKDNAAMKMLEKFGAQVKDSNGNLKNEVQLIDEVSKALLRAEAAGQGAAFRDIVGGRFWSGDFVTFLEDYAGNVELAGKIVKNGLANPALAHEVQGNINAMNTQAAQLGGVFASALMPVANDIVPRVTKEMGELTKIIAENADGIKTLGQVTADVVGGIGTVVSKAIIEVTKMAGAVGQAVKGLKELRTESPVDNDIIKLYLDDKEIENFNSLVQKELKRKFKPAELELLQASPSFAQIESTLRNQLKPTYDEIIRLRQEAEETTKKIREMNDALKETGMTTADANRQPSSPESLDAAKDIAKIFGEASDIIYKLNHNEYENKKYDLLKWRQDLINAESTTAEQRIAIEELYAAKLEQIEQEKEDRVTDIRENAERARHTDLENTLADIEKEKAKRIQAGMEAAEAIKLAAEESAAAVKNLEDAFTEKVNSFRNNALQNQYAAIDKERDSWIKQGISPEQANSFADEQKYEALLELEESFSQRINEIRGNDLENQLARIEQEKQAWIDKGIEETRAEELAAAQKAKVLQDYSERQKQIAKQEEQRQKQIAKAIEDYWKRVAESIERQFDEALSVLKSQLEAFRAYRDKGIAGLEEYERKQLKKQGITDEDLKSMTKARLEDFKQAQKDVKRNLLPNFQPVNDVPFPELPPPIETEKAFDGLNDEIYQTIKALDSFKNSLSQNPTESDSNGLPVKNITDKKESELPDVYRLSGMAESQGRKHWLFENDKLREEGLPSTHFADDTIFKNAREGLDYFNRDKPEYNPEPDFDPEIDLKEKLKALFGDLEGNGITDEFGRTIAAFDEKLAGTTQQLNDATDALSNMTDTLPNRDGYSQSKQPAIVNTNVQIDEAHAWDSEHIQELADRVAAIIEPAIINAIGGDSNGY